MKKALALLTYSRFDYFLQVWNSIKQQRFQDKTIFDVYDIHVFQDGLWALDTQGNIYGHQQIARFLSTESCAFKLYPQCRNLGIALHFDYAEKKLFIDEGYDFVVFCEDDLVLSPDYMRVMEILADRFANDSRVGMFSANPAQPTQSQEEQQANKQDYVLMGHHWAFGLSRTFWLRRQPLVEHYLDLIRAYPYRSRPHHRINNWLQRIGLRPGVTSQDHIKSCATCALGALKLATYANFGTPIGRIGVHCTDSQFEAMGFHNCVVFDGTLDSLPPLAERDYQRLLMEHGRNSFLNPAALPVKTWETRLLNGDFAPELFDLDAAVRRTEPCPCGSGKRFKHCCGLERVLE